MSASPSQYSLNATIITSTGDSVSIDYSWIEDLHVHQGIHQFALQGYVKIKDSINLISGLALCGNEYIKISFKTIFRDIASIADYTPFEKTFRIYKISNIKPNNLNSFTYIIHFCSEEFILNEQITISKSYKSQKPSEIIDDIVSNYLKIKTRKISFGDFEETILPQKIIIPNMRPFEAISWICSFSLTPQISSGFNFYETNSGFKFRSLQNMISSANYSTYAMKPQTIVDESLDKLDNMFVINDVEINQMFDVLSTMSSGGYSSKVVSLDLMHGKTTVNHFDPVHNNSFLLNEFLPFNEASNRNGATLIDGSSYMRYFPNFQGSLVDKWLLQRASQMALLNNNQMRISIYGDSQIEAGMVVYIDFPYVTPTNNPNDTYTDKYKSGRYLVTAVKHRICEDRFMTNLELCRDSSISAYPPFQSSITYETAKNL